jgi:phage shock protein PspC (stress-responsive transcriptional regulator)
VPRRLMRDPERAVFGGVAAGFGQYLDVDPVLVRLGFVLLAFVHGLGVLFYLACWLVMPMPYRGAAAPAGAPAGEPPLASSGFEAARETSARLAAEVRQAAPDATAAQVGIGATLVLVGTLLLAHNLDWLVWPHWLRFDTLWPLLLVALGVGLILRSRKPAAA